MFTKKGYDKSILFDLNAWYRVILTDLNVSEKYFYDVRWARNLFRLDCFLFKYC